MAKVRINKIDVDGNWLNIFEDDAATDLVDGDLSVNDVVESLLNGKSYTRWEVVGNVDNHVIQFHS